MSSVTTELDMQDVLRRLERCEHRQRALGGLLLATVVGGAFFSMRTPAISQTSGQIQAEIAALQNTLKYVTTTGTDMVISGANLHIVNGMGATTTKNGLGNLIVGYNELRDDKPSTDVRTGSHNLILGEENSFSSYGGIVGGRHDTITGTYSCVDSGLDNSATADYACVGGGHLNTASGQFSYVVGGQVNTASGLASTINGGQSNTASAQSASVSGGNGNTASGTYSIIAGGFKGLASASYAFVAGGQGNKATAGYSTVLGGLTNTANSVYEIVPLNVINTEITGIDTSITGINNSITGINTQLGTINTTLTSDGTAITNLQTSSTTYNTEITALQTNTQYISTGTDTNGFPATFITKCNVWVQDGSGTTWDNFGALTGLGNLIVGYNEPSMGVNPNGDNRTGSHNLIVGFGNTYTAYGGVVFGYGNSIINNYDSVTGGQFNTASGDWAAISGGINGLANGVDASITGGYGNTASGSDSCITGGFNNKIVNDPNSPGGTASFGAILGGLNELVNTEYGFFP